MYAPSCVGQIFDEANADLTTGSSFIIATRVSGRRQLTVNIEDETIWATKNTLPVAIIGGFTCWFIRSYWILQSIIGYPPISQYIQLYLYMHIHWDWICSGINVITFMAPLRTASLEKALSVPFEGFITSCFRMNCSILWVLHFWTSPASETKCFFWVGDHFWINHSGVLIMFKLKVHEQIWPIWWSIDTEPIYNILSWL